MISNRIGIAAVGLLSIMAAGVGGYVATRHNVAETPAEARTAATTEPVQETEALVTSPARPTDAAAPQPASPPLVPAPAHVVAAPPAAVKRQPAPVRPSPRPSAQSAAAAAAPLDRTWPSSAAPAPQENTAARQPVEETNPEPIRPPEPPAKHFSELVVSADSVIGLQTETTLSSERSRVEDRVEARVVRDVRVGGETAIPAGTRALGAVVVVDRGGKFKERARLGIRFHTLVLADGTRVPMSTETIYRYGDAPSNGSAARIGGGAVAGAILGAIIGGGKGAAIGATTGAGAGTASVMTSDRSEAVFPAGAEVTARIVSPVSITVEQD